MKCDRANFTGLEVFLQPGEFYFGDADTRIRTILGSCVAMTMWHGARRLGAMCHYLLPSRGAKSKTELDGRYGDEAYQLFLNEAAQHGVNPAEFEIKIFGGANMFPGLNTTGRGPVGDQNVSAGFALLERYGHTAKAHHVGGSTHRVVILDVKTGHTWLKRGAQALSGESTEKRRIHG